MHKNEKDPNPKNNKIEPSSESHESGEYYSLKTQNNLQDSLKTTKNFHESSQNTKSTFQSIKKLKSKLKKLSYKKNPKSIKLKNRKPSIKAKKVSYKNINEKNSPTSVIINIDNIKNDNTNIKEKAGELVNNFTENDNAVNTFNSKTSNNGLLSNILQLKMLQTKNKESRNRKRISKNFLLKTNATKNSNKKESSLNVEATLSRRTSISSNNNNSFNTNSLKELKIKQKLEKIIKKHELILLFCKLLIEYGSPSHRTESNMLLLSEKLNINCLFVSLPSLMIVSFKDPGVYTSETHMLRNEFGFDMYKLEKTFDIYNKIFSDIICIDKAVDKLNSIYNENPLYPWYVQLLVFPVLSFCCCPLFFRGGWLDALVSMVLGFLVGMLMLAGKKYSTYSNLFELLASILCSFIASSLNNYICYWSVVISSLILLLPGVTLTTSIVELASKNVVSGSVRMFYSLLVAFFMGFGISIGTRLWLIFESGLGPNKLIDIKCVPVSPYWNFLLFFIVSVTFNMSIMCHPKQWPVVTFISALGFLVSYFGPTYFDNVQIVPALTSFVIGLGSNLYSKLTNKMAIAPLLVGVLMLVPGSIGVKGTISFIIKRSSEGTDLSFQMIVVAMSISVGVFASTLVVYPSLETKKRAYTAF